MGEKWSSFPEAGTITGAEVMALIQGGVNVQTPLANAIGSVLFPATPIENQLGIVPTNTNYPFGWLQRWGGDAGGLTDSSSAWNKGVQCGYIYLSAGAMFKVVTGANRVGRIIIEGPGMVFNDSAQGAQNLLSATSADNSVLRDFTVLPITMPPTILRRYPLTINTTATTVSGNNNITVASASALSVGMQAYGPNLWNGCLITGISGFTVSLSEPAQATGSGSTVSFFAQIFNFDAVVTGITKASSAVITINTASVVCPFVTTTVIGINGVAGMTQINGLSGTITAVGGSAGAWTLTVNINSSGFTAYTSGGSVSAALPSFGVYGGGVITGITQAASAVVTVNNTTVSNPFFLGEDVFIWGVSGMTQINGMTGSVTATGGSSGAWTATVNINTSGFSGYASGGGIQPTGAINRYAPTSNDFGVWAGLTTPQKNSTYVGPVLSIQGNDCTATNIIGRDASILFTGNDNLHINCDMARGWTWAACAHLAYAGGPRTSGGAVRQCRIQDHSFCGALFFAMDYPSATDNYVIGVGESGIKTYQSTGSLNEDVTGIYDSCTALTSANNQSIANYQGAYDYTTLFGVSYVGNSSAGSSSTNDYAAWSPNGALGIQGSGWDVVNYRAELNPGTALVAQVSNSRFRNIWCRENLYNNQNNGYANNITITGVNNDLDGLRAYQETSRFSGGSGYQLSYYGGATAATSSFLKNVDLRDAYMSGSSSLQLSGYVPLGVASNILTNAGGRYNLPMGCQYRLPLNTSPFVCDLGLSDTFACTSASGALAVSPATNIPDSGGQVITIQLFNASGGSVTPTFNSGFHLAGTASAIAANSNMSYTFSFSGTYWYEQGRSAASVTT